MSRSFLALAVAGVLAVAASVSPTLAAGEQPTPPMVKWSFSGPFGKYDIGQLQRGFKVYRTQEGASDDAAKSWLPMRKGVADLDRRAEVSHAANNRLAESLATVAETQPLGELLKPLGQPVIDAGRRQARALNPLTGKDGELLRTLARGEFLLKGFRNADLRVALYGEAADAVQRRRDAARVTRQLALLRAHGLIVRVKGTHRYHLSAAGRRVVTCLLTAHASDVSRLAACA